MVLVILMFIVGAGLVIGGYAAVTKLPGMLAERRLKQRLQEVSSGPLHSGSEGDSSVVAKASEGPLPAVDRLVAQTRAGSWLSTLIAQSGKQTTPSMIVVMTLVLAGLAFFAAKVFLGVPFLPQAAAIVGAALPVGFLMNRRSARMRVFEEQFPEALDLLSRALRAGHAFQTAMGMVADELKEPVGPEFKKTFDQQNFGLPLREALQQMTERVPLLDVRFFVTAVLIQRETGGNLSEILDNLAHVVRERFKILRQVRVHTAHGRFTAFVLLALPAALACVLTYISPENMALLFKERMGQTMLIVAIIMQSIGFVWIRKVIKIEV
jgi:tight adherence protein B